MSLCRVDPECTKCSLSKKRTRVVPGNGTANSRIVFIGEAPGQEEDAEGKPFVGRAGKILDEALMACGTSRRQVFVTNLVKCRPPGNRRPKSNEVDSCFEYLESELEDVSPEVVCMLGRTVARFMLDDRRNLEEMLQEEREMVIGGKKVRVYVVHHPAACLYQRRNLESFRNAVRRSLEAAGLARGGSEAEA